MKRIITEPVQIQSKDGRVIGEYLSDGKVKVFKGSFFRNVEVNSIRQNVRNERLFLLNNDFISNSQLSKDYVFENPSLAISTLMGHMETGNQAFVTMDNIELGSYLETDSISAYEQHTKLATLLETINQSRTNNDAQVKLIDEDDNAGSISTNDIVSITTVEPEYIPLIKPEKIFGDKVAYKRKIEKAKKCIIFSNFKCDLDNDHVSFTSKNDKPYMEAHHLVPLSTQDYFDNSLDVDANIVCLCPNCHRKLHYGKDIQFDLKKLYDSRVEYLNKSGIHISFDELYELYQ
ncbi:MAG: HNH endonuclease [Candidatus Izemoplasmatales bacterium]